MQTSADIRRANMNRIRRILWSGGAYTKQQVSALTGLSVATCNTLLNELLDTGEAEGEKARSANVGRSSTLYRASEGHESILCVAYDLDSGQRRLFWHLLSVAGTVLDSDALVTGRLDFGVLDDVVHRVFLNHPNISVVVVGTPSIAEHGVIRHCDIPELDGARIVEAWTTELGVPVVLENDMHLKAYGFYRRRGTQDGIITLASFPAHVLPGTATVYGGRILRGHNQFAGMVGFLPYGMGREEYLERLRVPDCVPLMERAVVSIIAVVNPETIVFTGDLVDADILAKVREGCRKHIPEEYMPRFAHEENMDECFLEGMLQRALDEKEELGQ